MTTSIANRLKSALSSLQSQFAGEPRRPQVAGIEADTDAVSTIRPSDVENLAVRGLMRADALVIDPCLAFLNYADASSAASDWYDQTDEGSLAYERASALLKLYRPFIVKALRTFETQGKLPPALRRLLAERFELDLPGP